jgi:multidrug efflux pump subunit AcrA (membrane-fusion protein)
VVSYAVTIEVDPSDVAIRPGMTATTDILVAQRDNVLLVPNRAIKTNGQQRVVEVMRQGQIVQVPVTLGMRDEVVSEVLEGLEEGDEVVVSGIDAAQRSGRFPGGRFFGGRPPR